MKRFEKKKYKKITYMFCTLALLSSCLTAQATTNENALRLEQQRAMPVQSNQVPNWPTGPAVGAESAILMEMETGTILYEKNIHQKQYPASTTKILTTLIATERCQLDEMVTFSHDAVFDTPVDSNHIAMDVGQAITMEQCLSAILIRSANEVSFAVAEHITGSHWSDFADIMNERARELGCLDSHFVNPNGLPDENHYTSAYDLAMIGRAFFANELLCKLTLTRRLEIPASDTLPHAKLENNAMAIIPGGAYAYPYLVGCKTGYTNSARNCLVSCAEKNGMKLICVVLRDESPSHYEDTISLFEYGFSNFEKVNISQVETKYNINDTGLFYSGNDIFGSSRPFLALDRNDFIILPRTANFQDTCSTISYQTDNPAQAALVSYTYQGVPIGTARINFVTNRSETSLFDSLQKENTSHGQAGGKPSVIYINIVRCLTIVCGAGALFALGLLAKAFLKNYSFPSRKTRHTWKKERRRQRRQAKWPRFHRQQPPRRGLYRGGRKDTASTGTSHRPARKRRPGPNMHRRQTADRARRQGTGTPRYRPPHK